MKLSLEPRPVVHHAACACGRCCIQRAVALDMAQREENAGRAGALHEALRPANWKPRAGTNRAIRNRYGRSI